MNQRTESNISLRLVAANAPGGGLSPHVRVQYRNGRIWTRFASFRRIGEAEACGRRLESQGYQVRLIDCRGLPAAA